MRFLLVLAFIATVFATDCRDQFEQFKTQYNKTYNHDEEYYRYTTFCNNVNSLQDKDPNKFGITKFFDMTFEEFSKMYLNYRPSKSRPQFPVLNPQLKAIETDYFNWRDHGIVTDVKNQDACGSCWAESVTEELESIIARNNHPLTPLSVQQIVSCDDNNFGCSGGDTVDSYPYMIKYGLQSEKDYPYTGQDDSCVYNKSQVVARMTNFTYATKPCFDSCLNQDEQTLLFNLVFYGPISICNCASGEWFSYKSGVLENSLTCPPGYASLNHCTQLTGYGTDVNGKYWIVRNSWGEDWGVGGYIYLRYGKNMCGLADEATYILL